MGASSAVDERSQTPASGSAKTVVVIDNAFDLEITDAVTKEAALDFAEHAEDETLVSDLQANGIDLASLLSRDKETLLSLVAKLDSLVAARPAAEALLGDYLEERGPVDDLVKHLEKLGFKVEPLGANEQVPAGLKAELAFIDYYLDDQAPSLANPDSPDHAANARQKARTIYDSTRAYIILMSNREGVRAQETVFRQQARLLRGYFRFETKEKLSDETGLRDCISMLPLQAKFRHDLHDFIDCLEKRSAVIAKEFMSEIRELGLEDYAQLRLLSLNRDGQPFGDYTIRMFGAFLTSLVLDDPQVSGRVTALDKTEFKSFLPIQNPPSSTLGRIYLASLTEQLRPTSQQDAPSESNQADATPPEEHVKPPANEPAAERLPESTSPPVPEQEAQARAVPTGKQPEEETVALFPVEFGDLMVKDVESPLYAVMNPACDLQIGLGRSRLPDDTILLLPGLLRQLHQPFAGKRPPTFFTAMYVLDNHVYRIDWDYRRLRTVRHSDLPSEFLDKGYRFERRLQLGPALELQQHLLSSTSRVGLAVPPPLRRSVDVTVYGRAGDGEWKPLGDPVSGGVVVLHMRHSDEFAITCDGRDLILQRLAGHPDTLDAVPKSTAWSGSLGKGQYLAQLRQSLAKWRAEFPFFRASGGLPRGRTKEKDWTTKTVEVKDRLGVAVDTTVFQLEKLNADIVLVLDLGPMPLIPGSEGPREMEER